MKHPGAPGVQPRLLLAAPAMASRSDNLQGALTMMAGMAAFALSDACMKGLGAHVPLLQAMALRGLGVTAVLGVLAWRRGAARAAARRDWGLMGLRSVAEMACAWLYLSALLLMPVANVSAVFQALPLSVTVAGALVLGERVGPGRWAAVGVGFLGVLLIVRPGGAGWGWPAALVLGSVACVTGRDLLSRFIAPAVPSVLVAAVTAAGVTGFSALGSLWVDWRPVGREAGLLLLAATAMLVVGYVCVVSAMRRGEVSFVAPFRYSNLLAAVATGALFFGTWPDAATALGAAVVVGSGLFMLLRGARGPGEPAA